MPYPGISAFSPVIGGKRGEIGTNPRITSVARGDLRVNLTQT